MGSNTTRAGLPYPVGTDRVMDGDDAIRGLAERLDGSAGALASVPYAMACGQSNIAISAAVSGQVAITFPAGRFSQAPVVQMTCNSAGVNNMYGLRMTGPPGVSGFTAVANLAASGSATIPVGWLAIQMQANNPWG
jgi:hypothetical protein